MSTPQPSDTGDLAEAESLADIAARTVAYYDQNAEAFVAATVDVDMEELYKPFLELLRPRAHILDFGCGSGRDSLAFLKRRFRVTPMDASLEMAVACERLTGVEVKRCKFQDLEDENLYDGIWACASLLHVPPEEMDDVLRRLARASRPGAIWYLSFKLGQGIREKNGRLFVDHTWDSLEQLFTRHPALKLYTGRVTPDARPGRGDEKWLNVLVIANGPYQLSLRNLRGRLSANEFEAIQRAKFPPDQDQRWAAVFDPARCCLSIYRSWTGPEMVYFELLFEAEAGGKWKIQKALSHVETHRNPRLVRDLMEQIITAVGHIPPELP